MSCMIALEGETIGERLQCLVQFLLEVPYWAEQGYVGT